MSSKEYYLVPVYVMLAEDFVYGDIDFMQLDNIIVSKIPKGYEELDGFNNFVVLKSKNGNNQNISINNYSQCLFLNEDDIRDKNKVDVFRFDDKKIGEFSCYRKLNQNLKLEFYQKDGFDAFVKKQEEECFKRVRYGNKNL